MKIRNIILLPLISTLLFTACNNTKYDSLNAIKYAAEKLSVEYDELPRQGSYVAGKVFVATNFEDIKSGFSNYVPKGFDVKFDWYESSLVSGETTWNILYTNEITELEGELYIDQECGKDCIQLWVVTSVLDGEPVQNPTKTTYSDFHDKAVKAYANAPTYKKVTVKGVMSYMVEYQFDHEVTMYKGEWVLTKGDESLEVEAREVIMHLAKDVEEDQEVPTTYFAGSKGFIESFGYGAYTYNSFGFPTYLRSNYKSSHINLDVTWAQ